MRERIELGMRTAGDKAVLADEFITKSQLVAGDDVSFVDDGNDIKINVSNRDAYFIYEQNSATAIWHIIHNLGKNPAVSIVDSAGTYVLGQVNYLNENELIAEFKFAFAGKAFLN